MTAPLSSHGLGLLDRRHFLSSAAGLGLASLLGSRATQASTPPIRPVIEATNPLHARAPHYPAKAKRVLVLFCSGAVSHLDSWDWKPELLRMDGKPMPGAKENFLTFQGENGNLVRPLYEFKPRGQTGKMVSDLFPHLASMTDDLTFIHSMTAKSNTHGPAENQMSTGFIFDGFPSLGSWVSYALGSEADNLPAYVAIPDPRGVPQAGVNNWGNGFLPAVFQGTAFNSSRPIYNLARPNNVSVASDLASRDVLKFLNDKHLEQFPGDTELAARIASYELAAKMQLSVPEVSDLSKESTTTLKAYGVDDPNPIKSGFAKNCLLARRLLERGVRCVKLYNGAYAMGEGIGNWDGHKKLKEQYDKHAPIFDQPAAALIRDLRQRGLLEDTLVVWCTEFGRMPTFQKGASGRDHNPQGFTVWMTGAGVKPGISYGSTDALGHKAAENVTTIYDFHATILHLMGLDHERLSYYHNGIDRRLTDVHGHVIRDILA
ncbi:Protein of unknown function [Prosthecobacter debontii]|uniref:Tat (Twin-arginine translocation) pathway signal sequence n=1 Tax=Prosthecobacter debontii TaxID=48467 RepID=A0A1T4WRF8_9BACT|nr:DUF1501 domain-containing protein [Prosthecobacter debontii]SKA79950.1 Protein of unknown function [Prosthecobacter debontii]